MAWLEPFAGRRAAPEQLTARFEAYRDVVVGLRDRRLDPMAMLAEGFDLPPAFAARAA